MSENPGSNMWYGLGAQNKDLDTDAVPGEEEEESAEPCQTAPSSTTCSSENSGSNPSDQQDDETSRGDEKNCSAAHQTRRPDGYSDLDPDNFQFQRTEFTHQQSSQTEDKNTTKCPIFLPPELQQEHFDILIIHSEEDMPAAENLRKIIEELHAESIDGEKTPITVGLREDVALYVGNYVDWLDVALNCCTYIFVIFTEHLINDSVLSVMMKASLWATFSEENKNKFCPVYLEKGAKEELKLSVYVNVLISINMWKNQSKYRTQILKYIDVAPRLERCHRQAQEAKQYYKNHKDAAENVDLESGVIIKPIQPEPCKEDSLPVDVSKELPSAEPERHTEVENSLQKSTDWHSYYLPMTIGAVIAVRLAYLFHR